MSNLQIIDALCVLVEEQNYITDSQLERFKALGVITQEQYDELYILKHPVE